MPMPMADAIMANFPGADPRLDFRVDCDLNGVVSLAYWNAATMGRAKPNKATLERWMAGEPPTQKSKDKRMVNEIIGRKGTYERALFKWVLRHLNELRVAQGLKRLTREEALEDLLPELNAED